MRTIVVLLITSLFLPYLCSANDVAVCQTEKAKYRYRMALATLILEKTKSEYGPATLVNPFVPDPTQKRCHTLLTSGKIDLLYLPPTEKLLKQFAVIKKDIHNGMLGYRVFIINKKNKDRFSRIKTIEDLRQFEGGFGSQWGDFKMFDLNRLPVVGLADASLLLKMLEKGRFDYFHRGLHEAWAEVAINKTRFPGLMVEENIALVYDFPVYFMFNKKNPELKRRFEKGFKTIMADGSFKALYLKHFGGFAEKADLKKRTIIRLDYPMPKGLPPVDTSLWLD